MLIRRTRLSLAVSLLAAGSLMAGAAQAQDLIDNRPNVYAGAVGYVFDHQWDQDNGWGWQIGGEAPIAQRWAATIERYGISSDRTDALGDAEFSYSRLGLNYLLTPDENWQPYLSAGLGYARQDNSIGPEESDGSFDFGVGLKYFLTDNLFLRGDAKAIHVNGLGYWDFAGGISVGYAFGPKPRPAPPPPPPAPPPPPPPPPPPVTRNARLEADG
ncbi:MAG: porin family protein, partial [Pseudomonadales bacterium]|nr:porin family protein [Pseudomonadales bacterium]